MLKVTTQMCDYCAREAFSKPGCQRCLKKVIFNKEKKLLMNISRMVYKGGPHTEEWKEKFNRQLNYLKDLSPTFYQEYVENYKKNHKSNIKLSTPRALTIK